MRGGEADAELDRCQRDAAPDRAAGGMGAGVCVQHPPAAVGIVRGFLKLGDEARQDHVLDRLVIGGQLAVAIEVGLAHRQRVLTRGIGDFLDQPFGHDHALRPAKAAKRGVADGVRAQRMRPHLHVGIVIRVVGMKQRPVRDRHAEIGGKPAARIPVALHRADAAVIVEADAVIHDEIVALASRDHVVVAIGAQLDRAVPFLRGDGGDAAEQVHLRFLAAEPAPHAAHVHDNRVGRHPQRVRDHVLHLGRVLGRGEDRHLVILAGNRQRDLAFQIEVVLPADFHATRDHARGGRHRLFGFATAQGHARHDQIAAGFPRRDRIQHERQVVIFHARQMRGAARLIAGFGDHGKDRLAPEPHLGFGKDRIVVALDRADVVLAGNVGGGQHVDNAGRRAHRVQIQRGDAAVRAGRQPQIGMQRAFGQRQVVGVIRATGDVFPRGIVGRIGAVHGRARGRPMSRFG